MSKFTKKIIINSGIYENRVAILDNEILEEYYVEQKDTQHLYGNIYKGIVESVLPGLGAAFVNIGTSKNGFLYISDVLDKTPQDIADEEEIIIEKEKKRNTDIGSLLKVRQEIIVQVDKEPVGTKGPRLTSHVSLPGRYLVLTPFDESIGISKRISDLNERNRIRGVLNQMNLPKGMGFIIRTAAKDVDEKSLKREIKYLINLWARIMYRSKKIGALAVLYEEYDLILRIVRDQFTDDVEKIAIDSKDKYKRIIRFLSYFMPALRSRIFFYNGISPIFEKYGIEQEIEKIFERKIDLKSGGSIFIEQTEGMVAIDVNTAKYKGKRDIDETIFNTNLEAAREIARQIRLRDVGGIIIIDFIDMRSKAHKQKVQETLESNLKKDKAKTNILSISSIGVVEMTRQRMRRNLESTMYKKCPYCSGRGLVKSDTTIAMQILRKVEKAASGTKKREMKVRVHPDIHNFLVKNEKEMILPLMRRCRMKIQFFADYNLQLEKVEVE